jgi:uncharacterized phage-associated protein
MSSSLNKEKYTNALQYFITECNNEKLGIVKLNKLFYYLDFISYRDTGKSVTNDTYKRLPKGPFAENLEDVIESAKQSKLIECKQDESERYGKRNRFQVIKQPVLSIFSDYEKKLLVNLCKTFKDWSTDQMIAQTHTEAPWVFSVPSKALDYKNADDIEFFAVPA